MVYSNKWSVVNAMEAKRPFLWKSLCAILDNSYTELNEEPLRIKTHGEIGYMPSATRHVQELLQFLSSRHSGEKLLALLIATSKLSTR
jgi:hypothetical protein